MWLFIYFNVSCWSSHWIRKDECIGHYWPECDQWPVRSVESNNETVWLAKRYTYLWICIIKHESTYYADQIPIIAIHTSFCQIISLLSSSPILMAHVLNVTLGIITFARNVSFHVCSFPFWDPFKIMFGT
jgi:hypothetical protein